jgi:hypothetical protein
MDILAICDIVPHFGLLCEEKSGNPVLNIHVYLLLEKLNLWVTSLPPPTIQYPESAENLKKNFLLVY